MPASLVFQTLPDGTPLYITDSGWLSQGWVFALPSHGWTWVEITCHWKGQIDA